MYTSSTRADRPHPPSSRALRCGLLAVALGSLLIGGIAPATALDAGARPSSSPSWTVGLGRTGAQEVNLLHSAGTLRVDSRAFHPAAAGAGAAGYASQTEAAHTLATPVNHIAADLRVDLPAGASATVDVRGRTAGGNWTEWREAAGGQAADLPAAVTVVQSRITLRDTTGTARVRGLRLSAELVSTQQAVQPRAISASVYATREGLVGGTTANGHVIQTNDHFVALPSPRGLSPNGSSQYSVQVCGPVRCETAPVWDVGPWNTTDDYWNPSSVRQSFGDLAQGLPEAQAAYQNGYNGGLDGFGRQVSNPAGIDLADGTFYNIGLNDNGWVTVTYLWTGGSTPPPSGKYYVDTFSDAAVYASPTSTTQTGTLYKGTNYVYCKVWGREIGSGSSYNHYWLRTDPDVGPANQYVSAYYLSRWGNDEAKDNNGTVIPDC